VKLNINMNMDTIAAFLSESWDDIKSPTTSEFTSKIHQLKDLVGNFEQVISYCLLLLLDLQLLNILIQ